MVSSNRSHDNEGNKHYHPIPKIKPSDMSSHHCKVAKQTMSICASSILATATSPEELLQSMMGLVQGIIPAFVEQMTKQGLSVQTTHENACKAALTTTFGLACSLYFDDVEDIMTCLRLTLDKMGYSCFSGVSGGTLQSSPSLGTKSSDSLNDLLKKFKEKLSGNSPSGDDLFDD